MKKTVLLLLAFLPLIVASQGIPIDKQYHAGAGVVLSTWGTFAGSSCLKTPEQCVVWGLASATIAGIGKELWDQSEHWVFGADHYFDFKDLGATMIGGVIGTGLSYMGLKIFKKKKPQMFVCNIDNSWAVGFKVKF